MSPYLNWISQKLLACPEWLLADLPNFPGIGGEKWWTEGNVEGSQLDFQLGSEKSNLEVVSICLHLGAKMIRNIIIGITEFKHPKLPKGSNKPRKLQLSWQGTYS